VALLEAWSVMNDDVARSSQNTFDFVFNGLNAKADFTLYYNTIDQKADFFWGDE
jgi:filamentous hemagglutinin